jgi:hypothetical protein
MTVLGPNDPRAVYRPENYAWWCKRHFNSMAEGGVWAVSRSGLVFQKQDDKLVLILRMPFAEIEGAAGYADIPSTEAELLKYQDEDYTAIRDHFASAGITVEQDLTAN